MTPLLSARGFGVVDHVRPCGLRVRPCVGGRAGNAQFVRRRRGSVADASGVLVLDVSES